MVVTTAKPAARLDPAFVKLAVVLLIGVVAVTFDTTIVNVALDTIGRDLHTTVSASQWTVTGFGLAMALLKPTEKSPARRLDLIGLGLLSPALALLIYGLSQFGGQHGFTGFPLLGPLVLGVVLLAAYVVYALRMSGHAVIDLRLFRVRSFA